MPRVWPKKSKNKKEKRKSCGCLSPSTPHMFRNAIHAFKPHRNGSDWYLHYNFVFNIVFEMDMSIHIQLHLIHFIAINFLWKLCICSLDGHLNRLISSFFFFLKGTNILKLEHFTSESSFLALFDLIWFHSLLGLHLQHMEVPRLGVESELQFQACTTATQDLSCVCNLHHSLRQRQSLNPLQGKPASSAPVGLVTEELQWALPGLSLN